MESNLTLASKEPLLAKTRHSLRLLPMPDFTTHFTSVDCSRATFGGLLLEDILQDLQLDDTREESDVLFPHEDPNVPCSTSIPEKTRPHLSSHPPRIRVASFVSSSPVSAWFDDSPTRSVFAIANEDASTLSWDDSHEDFTHPTFSDRESDRTSIVSFDPFSEMTSSPTSESQDSQTMVPTDDDSDSSSSDPKHCLNDCLDDQLVFSPMESFAAMCWDAAVVPEKPRLNVNKAAELRLSRLYSDAARKYEEAHIRQSSCLASVTLPRMKFDDVVQVSKAAPPEVAPWLYVSNKATSVLDLPQDLSTTPKHPPPSVTPPRAVHQRHRRGKSTLGSITKLPFSLRLGGNARKQ